MENKLTVLIPCRNEHHNIEACIDSVRPVANEILVADSGSTDRTLEIVRGQPDCRLIERQFVDYANFKNWAIPQASHDWVLIVDADERLTDQLQAEIKTMLTGQPEHTGYRVRRLNYFFGHRVRFGKGFHDWHLRLFRRDEGRYRSCRVHESLKILSGTVGNLRHGMEHFTCDGFDYYEKVERYTTWVAQDRLEQGKTATAFSVISRGPWEFFRQYVLRLGFLDGRIGLIVSALSGIYSMKKQAKLWTLCNSRSVEMSSARLRTRRSAA